MLRRFLLSILALVLLTAPALAADGKPSFSPEQKAEIEAIIKQYINDNPQVMISSVEAYYNKQQATKQKQEGSLDKVPPGLLDNPQSPFVGPKDAKLVIVEFFDYNCGYCKQVYSDVQRITKEEPDVKVIFKDLPILSDTSELAARYALAANKQGKYYPFHLDLMRHQGPISEEFLLETAKSNNIDVEKLKVDANSQDIRDLMQKDVELARELGVRGTPFFVIGKEKVPGAIGYSQMKEILNKERGIKTPGNVSSATTTTTTTTPDASAKTTETTTTTSDDAGSDISTGDVMKDPEVQDAIAKARAETAAMIDEIKQQAEELKKQSAETMKKAAEEEAKNKKTGGDIK